MWGEFGNSLYPHVTSTMLPLFPYCPCRQAAGKPSFFDLHHNIRTCLIFLTHPFTFIVESLYVIKRSSALSNSHQPYHIGAVITICYATYMPPIIDNLSETFIGYGLFCLTRYPDTRPQFPMGQHPMLVGRPTH
jgi:hypothetical protein